VEIGGWGIKGSVGGRRKKKEGGCKRKEGWECRKGSRGKGGDISPSQKFLKSAPMVHYRHYFKCKSVSRKIKPNNFLKLVNCV